MPGRIRAPRRDRRALASILCKGTVLGGGRRFLGFRLELLPRPRRLEAADVARNPGGTRVGLMTSLQGDVLFSPRHTGSKPVTLLRRLRYYRCRAGSPALGGGNQCPFSIASWDLVLTLTPPVLILLCPVASRNR